MDNVIDIRAKKDKAEELYLKKKWKDALKEFEIIRSLAPEDLRTSIKIGDIYFKMNQIDKAVEEYKKVADGYIAKSLIPQAISMTKKILGIKPNDEEAKAKIVKLYAERGLPINKEVKISTQPIVKNYKDVKKVTLQSGEKDEFKEKVLKDIEDNDLEGDLLLDDFGDGVSASQIGSISGIKFKEVVVLEESSSYDEEFEGEENEEICSDEKEEELVSKRWPLFSELNEDEFLEIVNRLKIKTISKDKYICKEGEKADSLYIIKKGIVSVSINYGSIYIGDLGDGEFIGEFGVLTSNVRHATVIAKTDTTLLELSQEDIKEVCIKYPRIFEILLKYYNNRTLENILVKSEAFKSLIPSERKKILNNIKVVNFKKGHLLNLRTDNNFYFIKSGKIDILNNIKGQLIKVATLEEGELFGRFLTETENSNYVAKSITDIELITGLSSLLDDISKTNKEFSKTLNKIKEKIDLESYTIYETLKMMETTLGKDYIIKY